jgi:hypothetical protein
MSKPATIVPVKQYGRPDLDAAAAVKVDTSPPDLTLVVAELRTQNKRLRDKIARLERMLEDELRMWKRGLDSGEWETRETLRRRMSRIRGAVEYLGNENGWAVAEPQARKNVTPEQVIMSQMTINGGTKP